MVDRGAGTATWLDKFRKQNRVDLRIGNSPGELRELVRAVYRPILPNAWFTTLG